MAACAGWCRRWSPLAAASGALLFWSVGEPMFAGLFLAGCVAMLVAAFIAERRSSRVVPQAPVAAPDFALVGAALDLVADPAALTRGDGSLVIINGAYRRFFADTLPPHELGDDEEGNAALDKLRVAAWRDGSAGLLADRSSRPPGGGRCRARRQRRRPAFVALSQ